MATNRYDYDSWGKVSSNEQSKNSIGYTGQRLDNETGLMALGNGERYYSPTLARFIQQDSFAGSLTSPESLNRFSYAHNNPNKFTDPTGNAVFIPILWGLAYAAVFLGSLYVGVSAVEEAKTVEKRNEEQIKQGVDPANLPNPTLTAVANNTPFIGPAFRAVSGQDPITGEDLSAKWRAANAAFAVLDILPFTRTGSKVLDKLGKPVQNGINWFRRNAKNADDVAPKAVKLFQESSDELGSGIRNLKANPPTNKTAEILEQLRNNEALSRARTTADDVSAQIANKLKQADELDPYRGLGMADEIGKGNAKSTKLIGPAGDAGGFTLKDANKINQHHTIPKYMGGVEDQVLAPLKVPEHRAFHEFLDNWKSGLPTRTSYPLSARGAIRLWERENPGIFEFARSSRDARVFIINHLRDAYKEFGIYEKVKDIFESEAVDYILRGKK